MPVIQQPHEEAWEAWSPRAEIAPLATQDAQSVLRIASRGDINTNGGWRRRITNITAGKTYRFSGYYRAENVAYPKRSISARLVWLTENEEFARPPDYAGHKNTEGERTLMEYIATAPENAKSVRIELELGWTKNGAVWWDEVNLTEIEPPKPRLVRAMTLHRRPRNTGSPAESVEEFCRIAEATTSQKPDILCLPEGINGVGTRLSYYDSSEPIPGATTLRLGELAQKMGCYIVAGIYERAGDTLYNSAVLIGRNGELEGVYRKTHLPREESDGGITHGDSYPVFHTDFGTIGMLICWDVQFPEAARALGIRGAEMIFLPIAGGSEILAKARAIENHLFLVTSSYDMKTFIVDPTGAVLAEANDENPVAVAEIDLDHTYIQWWLGDMKWRTWRERRPDIPVE